METPEIVRTTEEAASSGLSNSQFAQILGTDDGSVEHAYLSNVRMMLGVAIGNYGVPEEDAETLVHDVFLTYLLNRCNVRTPRAYLMGGMRRACLKYQRTKCSDRRVFSPDETVTDEARPSPGDFSDELSIAEVVAVALAKLDDKCRDLLHRRYVDDQPTDEIAEAIRTTRDNVNYILHCCRKRFRDIYDALTKVPE